MPNFIGYILIYLGVKELKKQSKTFGEFLHLIIVCVMLSIIINGVKILMIDINNILLYILDIVLATLFIFILYKIIIGIRDLEDKEERVYGFKLLFNTWKMLSIITVLNCLSYFVPENYNIILLIGYFLFSFIFLFSFYRTKRLYNKYH